MSITVELRTKSTANVEYSSVLLAKRRNRPWLIIEAPTINAGWTKGYDGTTQVGTRSLPHLRTARGSGDRMRRERYPAIPRTGASNRLPNYR